MKKNCFTTEVLSAFKLTLSGLPSFSRLVMYDLLSYCDYPSGTISINTIDDPTEHDFRVNLSSKHLQETINSDTLRAAICIIQEERPDYFIVKTENQSVRIDMPFLRELHQSFYAINQPDSIDNTMDCAMEPAKKPPVFITCACGIRSQTIE